MTNKAKMPDLTDRELDVLAARDEHWAMGRLVQEVKRYRDAKPSHEEIGELLACFRMYGQIGEVRMTTSVVATIAKMVGAYVTDKNKGPRDA